MLLFGNSDKKDIMKRLTLSSIFKKHPFLLVLGVVGLVIITMGLTVSVQSAIFATLIISEIVLAISVGLLNLQRFGFELVTVTAVLGGFLYGPTTGLTLGIVLSIFHYLLSQSFGPYIFYSVPLFGAIGFLAGTFAGSNIILLGIGLSLGYNLATSTIGSLLIGDIAGELMWSGSNFAINFFLFTQVIPSLL
jgi:hypothetical protein